MTVRGFEELAVALNADVTGRTRTGLTFVANCPACSDGRILAWSRRRIVRDEKIGALAIDSVGPAAGGEPESAQVAMAFFAASRSLGVPIIASAHTTKNGASDDKPFGSTYWHNLARRTWLVRKQQDEGANGLTIGLFNKKNNTGPLANPLAYRLTHGERIGFTPVSAVNEPGLNANVSLWQRVAHSLRFGSRTIADLATELDASPDAVRMAVERRADRFADLGGRGKDKTVGLRA